MENTNQSVENTNKKSFKQKVEEHPIATITICVIAAVTFAWTFFNKLILAPTIDRMKIECQSQSTLPLNAFNNDPLKIVGTWYYVVTPGQNKKLRGLNPKTNKYEDKYVKIKGWMKVDSLKQGLNKYALTGKRTHLVTESGINDIKDGKESKLDFPPDEVTHDILSNNKFSFKFEVNIGVWSQGFVRITSIDPIAMTMGGDIHYLYNDNQWRQVEILFTKYMQ
jgi:hypothetical protein